MGNDLLGRDLYHITLEDAKEIVEKYDNEIYKFLDANKNIYEEFEKAEQEEDYTLAEFLWYSYWEEVADFLNK